MMQVRLVLCASIGNRGAMASADVQLWQARPSITPRLIPTEPSVRADSRSVEDSFSAHLFFVELPYDRLE